MLSGYLFRFLAYCTVLACLLVPSNMVAGEAGSVSESTPVINYIAAESISKGDNVVIYGESFGKQTERNSIILQYVVENENKQVPMSKFNKWTDSMIEFTVPEDFPSSDTMVKIVNINGHELKTESQKAFLIQDPDLNEYIKMAIELKKSLKADESFVLEFLANEQQKDINENPKDYKDKALLFQGKKLKISEIDALTTSGFSQDFIGKLAGMDQYFTLGVAAIWLSKNHDVATAPILRIICPSRSYFAPSPPLISKETWWKAIKERVDLNFGYTAKSETDSGAESISTNYVLAGGSFEVNKGVLINLGCAVAVKDVNDDKRQFYFGLTVDTNVLKQLGIISKD